jgi:hypothetical protein
MAKGKNKNWIIPGIGFFFVYIFAVVWSIPEETVLVPRWLNSLESNLPVYLSVNGNAEAEKPAESNEIIPYVLGNRFGYIGNNGYYVLNQTWKEKNLTISLYGWSEYEAIPSSVEVFDPQKKPLMTINNPQGYPLFLDNRVFLVGSEQNSISALNNQGEITWTYDFPATLTCIDAAAGYVAAGTLDGAVDLLNASGVQVFSSFEPGGSRLAVILGCAISRDGSRLAIVSGIDNQRFLLLEQSGDTYRVIYHEFLSTGFRRAVYIRFIDNDSKVAFEREGGIGIYDTASRVTTNLAIEGEIIAMGTGDERFFFILTSQGENLKRLVGIKLPGSIFMNAPFRSEQAFLEHRNSRIYLGGDLSLACLKKKKR